MLGLERAKRCQNKAAHRHEWQLLELTLYVDCVRAGASFRDGNTPRTALSSWLACASITEGTKVVLDAGHWRGGSRRLVLSKKFGIICNLLP